MTDFHIHPHGYWRAEHAAAQHRASASLASFLVSYLDHKVPTYDFGCGLGTYLYALQDVGFQNLRGFEGDPPDGAHFKTIERHDLTTPLVVSPPGNVICLEVAEHIPAEHAETLIDTITGACADRLVMSWAVRGQGGSGHVNELDEGEVVPMFERRGFTLDTLATSVAREMAGADLWWFKKSILVWRRR